MNNSGFNVALQDSKFDIHFHQTYFPSTWVFPIGFLNSLSVHLGYPLVKPGVLCQQIGHFIRCYAKAVGGSKFDVAQNLM